MEKEQMTEITNSVKEIVDTKVNELTENMRKIENQMLKNEAKPTFNLKQTIFNNLNSDEFKTAAKNAKNGIDYSFETKDAILNAGVILDPTSFGQVGIAPVVLPMRETGVGKVPARALHVTDLITWGTTNSSSVDWIEVSGKTNGSAMRAEGGKYGQGDVSYHEISTKVKIASEYMKVTNESLKDASFLASEINSELLSDLQLLIDTQLLSGDGTGNNLKGIDQYATVWAAGSFAGIVNEPNEADVLRVAINQILVAGNGKYFPNAILMNPTDVTKLDLLKITDGRYIEVPYYDGETQTVIRVPIVQNVGITAGLFKVADFTKAKAFLRDPLTIRVFDQNEDDALYNRSTITGNIRLAFRIKNTDTGAFVAGAFSTAKAALSV